jgi:tRNA A37 threonylcarbamoyladenosine synthetase subunit TsaC/SUA5/YrdC
MAIDIHTAGIAISASTSTARGVLPLSPSSFVRVVNGSTSLAYINAGDGSVNATSANIALEPSGVVILKRNPNTDTNVAVLLVTGTGIVSASPVSQSEV